ncbi:hypothetical protein [Acinetobacter sp. c3-l95]|uniref:hypothetical protein n=1 Tax=Acinetobacter sp. c3-l95 TaxID=3342804 RepID=UPI0035BA986A
MLSLLDNHNFTALKLNEAGDLSAGFFAPLAFIVLLSAYIKQNKAQKETEEFLKEQAIAMKAQAKASEEQANAMKAQVKAIKEQVHVMESQSNVLTKQLDIAQSQLEYHINEIESRKANYILCSDYLVFKSEYDHDSRQDRPFVEFMLKNIGLESQIKEIEVITNNSEHEFLKADLKEESGKKGFTKVKHEIYSTESEYINYCTSLQYRIYYASKFSAISGNDVYIFEMENNKLKFRRLKEYSQKYQLRYMNFLES